METVHQAPGLQRTLNGHSDENQGVNLFENMIEFSLLNCIAFVIHLSFLIDPNNETIDTNTKDKEKETDLCPNTNVVFFCQ